jgi:hypothetical protein
MFMINIKISLKRSKFCSVDANQGFFSWLSQEFWRFQELIRPRNTIKVGALACISTDLIWLCAQPIRWLLPPNGLLVRYVKSRYDSDCWLSRLRDKTMMRGLLPDGVNLERARRC